MKQQFVVTHTIRQTEIPAFLNRCVTNTPSVKMLCPLKNLFLLIRVIHKSVKYSKNSQQIDYSTDHGISYADRERNSPSFFYTYISQKLNISTLGNTADIYAIVHLVPHACQHITVDQSHSSGDTVAKNLEISREWGHKDSVLHKPP